MDDIWMNMVDSSGSCRQMWSLMHRWELRGPKKVEEAKAAHQQMLSAQALPKMDRQEFSYSCGSKTKIFIDFHKTSSKW